MSCSKPTNHFLGQKLVYAKGCKAFQIPPILWICNLCVWRSSAGPQSFVCCIKGGREGEVFWWNFWKGSRVEVSKNLNVGELWKVHLKNERFDMDPIERELNDFIILGYQMSKWISLNKIANMSVPQLLKLPTARGCFPTSYQVLFLDPKPIAESHSFINSRAQLAWMGK